jgi:hypothetical protein
MKVSTQQVIDDVPDMPTTSKKDNATGISPLLSVRPERA